jgi:DNA-binding Lrp family transcriptional regulator
MKFSHRDLEIIAAAQGFADQPLAELASALREKEHTVRRVINRALETGALRRRVLVSLFELGFQEYVVFFSAGAKTLAQRKLLRDVLLKAPYTELVLEVGGRFNFGVVLLTPSVLEFESFFNYIVSESRVPITDVQLQVRTGWHFFGAKYLSKGLRLPPIHLVPTARHVKLSSGDGRILHAFATSETGKVSEIARKLGMPIATCQYQIDRLRKSGAVAGVRYQVVPEVVGHQPFRALVMTSLPLTAPRMQIMEWARQNPYVVTMMHGVGVWQYELRIEAPNYATAALVVEELTEKFASVIQNVELIPVIKVLKMQLHPDYCLLDRPGESRQ